MANKNDEELMKMDLYKLLAIDEDASNKEISKAYRKKAIECHPDKNPDNPEKAKEMFDLIQKARDLLKDIGKRAEYDHKQKAKRAAEQKTKQYDAKRRKMAEVLKESEKKAEEERKREQAANSRMSELERHREINLKIIEDAQREEAERARRRLEAPAVLKVKWRKQDATIRTEHVYDQSKLEWIFGKYGQTTIVLKAKKRVALIEFEDPAKAILAKSIESGFAENPFTSLDWVGTPPSHVHYQRNSSANVRTHTESLEEMERRIFGNIERQADECRKQKQNSQSTAS